MTAYVPKHRAALISMLAAAFVAIVAIGGVCGVFALRLYVWLESPYVARYIAAAGVADPMFLGGRVSLGAVVLNCGAIIAFMAPWAFVSAQVVFEMIAVVDEFIARSLAADSHQELSHSSRSSNR